MKTIFAFCVALAVAAIGLSQPTPAGGGVSKITAGTGITISPASGLGNVTINASGSGSGNVTNSGTLTLNSIALGAGTTVVKVTATGAGVVAALGVTAGNSGGIAVQGGPGIFTTGSFTGIVTMAGAQVNTANAMGALAIDVTKYFNTKTIAADQTFTFTGTPATTDTFFGLWVTNSDSSVHTLTIPSSFSISRNSAITTVSIPANGEMFLVWRYNGSAYKVTGDPVATNGTGNFLLSAGTIAITTGKTLTVTGSMTQSVTDASTVAFGAGGTVVYTTGIETIASKKIQVSAALGTDDTYDAIKEIAGLNAGATIAQWEVVYLGGSSTWLLADANGSSTYPAVGLAVAAYSSTNPAIVVTSGTVRNDAWNWTPGGNIYLSATPGALTQTAPSTTGDKVQVIGRALTADIMDVNPSADYGVAP